MLLRTERSMPSCRFCGTALRETLVDLGMSPLCESYLAPHQLNQMEPFYPLRVYVCGECFLVQLEAYVSAEHIFSDYAYFSSYSESWVEHASLHRADGGEVPPRAPSPGGRTCQQRRLSAPTLSDEGDPRGRCRASGQRGRRRLTKGRSDPCEVFRRGHRERDGVRRPPGGPAGR